MAWQKIFSHCTYFCGYLTNVNDAKMSKFTVYGALFSCMRPVHPRMAASGEMSVVGFVWAAKSRDHRLSAEFSRRSGRIKFYWIRPHYKSKIEYVKM